MKYFEGEVFGVRRFLLNRGHHGRAVTQNVDVVALFDLTAGPDGNTALQAHDVRMAAIYAAIDYGDPHSSAGARGEGRTLLL